MSSRIIISGVQGGSAINRREINELVNDDKHFSLYIQALQLMYGSDQSLQASFFQVAGIHGLPFIPWGGSNGPSPFNPNLQWGGYCVHGSVLFPTWHRPYILLFEQILWNHTQEIAAKYTVDTEDWQQAAVTLRQPYWDWAANTVPPAQVLSDRQVTITDFTGNRVLVDNPLLAYRFHPIHPSFPARYRQWPTTLRRPTSTGPNATSNVTLLGRILASAQRGITTSTFNMLTRVHTWPEFSSHTVSDGGSDTNSVEIIHDNIHGLIGGHMGDPGVASFDPIFFLHHCNVDRLLSLWSAMNPGVWLSRGDSEDGTWTMRAEVPVDANTPLTPFRDTQSSFWASASVTDTARLGYSYPEFDDLDLGNADAVQTAISQKITELYGRFSPAPVPRRGPSVASERVAAAAVEGTRVFVHSSKADESSRSAAAQVVIEGNLTNEGEEFWDWTARIEFKKYELGTSFYIFLFLGSVPENPEDWLVDTESRVGLHYAFVNSSADQCANCRSQIQVNVTEECFVSLTQAILEKSGQSSLSPKVVTPYLTENLLWRVQKADGEVAELESLEVTVVAKTLSYPPGANLPVPGERHRYPGITMSVDLPSEVLTEIFTLASDEDLIFQHGLPTSLADSSWFRHVTGDWALRTPQEATNLLMRRSSRTKKAILLTCKRWYEVGFELLFRCLYFNSPAKLSDLCNILKSSSASATTVTSSYGWWTRRLHVCRYSTRELEDNNFTNDDMQERLISIISHCPNLEIFHVEWPMKEAFGPVVDALMTHSKRSLRTVSWNVPCHDLRKVIWALDSLKFIVVAQIEFEGSSTGEAEEECVPNLGSAFELQLDLKRLRQLSVRGYSQAFLEQATGWLMPALKMFSIDSGLSKNDRTDVLEFLAQHGDGLEFLDLNTAHGLDVSKVLDQCSQLSAFTFNADWRMRHNEHETEADIVNRPKPTVVMIGLHGLNHAFGVGAAASVGNLAHSRIYQRSNDMNMAALNKRNFPNLQRIRALNRGMLTDLNQAGRPSQESGGMERWERWWDRCSNANIRLEDCTGDMLGNLPVIDAAPSIYLNGDENSFEVSDSDDDEEEEEDSDESDESDDEDASDSDEEDGPYTFHIPPLPTESNGERTAELRQLLEECRLMGQEREESSMFSPMFALMGMGMGGPSAGMGDSQAMSAFQSHYGTTFDD